MAINFQINAPLAKELDEIYQKCKSHKESMKIERREDVDKFINFVKRELVPALKDIIGKHTGIELTEVRLSRSPQLSFAIIPKLNSIRNTIHVTGAAYGLYPTGKPEPSTADELTTICTAFNQETGKVELDSKKVRVSAIFFFDPYCAFLPKETIHNSVSELEVKELTAITLHELGHVLALVERSMDMTYRIERFRNAISYFQKNATVAEQTKFIGKAINRIDNAKEKELLAKTLEKISNLDPDKNRNTPANLAHEIGIGLTTACMLILYPIFLVNGYLDRSLTEKLIDVVVNDSTYKTSDVRGSINNYVRIERYADEYASRFGYGKFLISALIKLGSQSICSMIGSVDPVAARRTSSISYFMALNMVNVIYPLYYALSFDIHGSDLERAEHALQDLAPFFKQDGVPPEIIDEYMGQYSELQKLIQELKRGSKNTWANATKKAFELLVYVAGPTSIWDMIMNGRITHECDELSKQINALIKNPLYYISAQLKKL